MINFFQIISFKDAADARKELLKNAKEKLENLLAEKVTSYHETWPNARRILEDKPEYKDYVRLEGAVRITNTVYIWSDLSLFLRVYSKFSMTLGLIWLSAKTFALH